VERRPSCPPRTSAPTSSARDAQEKASLGRLQLTARSLVPPSNCTPPDALVLEKPLPDDALRIVAKGEKENGPEGEVPEHLG
jgi:hypothetical protein